MPILVDPKSGTDVVQTDFVLPIDTDWSWYGWLRRPSTTSGQPMSMGSGHLVDFYYSSSTADRMTLDRVTSGTMGRWRVNAADDRVTYSASSWVWIGVTQAGIATPKVYTAQPASGVDFGACTVTTATTPTGSASTGTGQRYYIGNWSGLDYALGGDLAWVGFHNVALTEGEMREAYLRGFTLRSPVLLSTLESTSRLFDLSGRASTLTNSGAADSTAPNPPLNPVWRRSGAGILVPASSGIVYPTSAAVTAQSSVTAAPARRRGIVAAVASVSTVTANAVRRRAVVASVAGSSSVAASAGARRPVAPSMMIASSVQAVPSKFDRIAAGVDASSGVAATPLRKRGVAPAVVASSSVVAAVRRNRGVQAHVQSATTVTVTPTAPTVTVSTVAAGVYP